MSESNGDKTAVAVGSDAYRDGWERIFGKAETEPPRKIIQVLKDGFEQKDVVWVDNCGCDNPATCGCCCHDYGE